MSKLVFSLWSLVFGIVFCILYFVFCVTSAHAAVCNLAVDPSQIQLDDPSFKNILNIKTPADCLLIVGTKYIVMAYPQSVGEGGRSFDATATTPDGHSFTLDVDFKLSWAREHVEPWIVRICTDPGEGQSIVNACKDGANTLLSIGGFQLTQLGGKQFNIEAVKPLYQVNSTPQVRINYAKKGNTYLLWWDGDILQIHEEKATTDGNPIITLDKAHLGGGQDPNRFSKVGQQVLCAALETKGTPPLALLSGGCNIRAVFNFTDRAVPNDISCSINPEEVRNDDDPVTISGVNLEVGATYESYLAVKDQPEQKVSSAPVPAEGTLSLPLGGNLTIGEYVGILKKNGDTICKQEFSVLDKSVVAARTCKAGENGCSSAAGEFCNGNAGINTAIGCIPTDPTALINSLLRVVTVAAGGVALLLMAFGSLQMIVSAGNQDLLKAGRERFSSAVIGLLFIIFSVLLLQIIGVNILSIPGFR